MKKVLLIFSLVAWCGIQHFDLISRTYDRINTKPGGKTFNFEMNSFPDHSLFSKPVKKVFFMQPIEVEKMIFPTEPEKLERKKGSIRISSGPDDASTDILFNMLKS